MARVTVRDVAKHAGVSTATVSFVLNENPIVATTTRARVQKALSELGYVYDRSAASLRTQRTDAVGLIITSLRNPFFAEFAMGIQRSLATANKVVLLGVSDEDRGSQSRLLRVMGEHRIDGVVMIPAHDTTAADLTGFGDVPLILLARHVPGAAADYVGADNVTGAKAAADHLLEHGCRNVAFVGGYADSSARTERLSGVRAAFRERGGRRNPLAPACPPDRESAAGVARTLLARGRHGTPGIPVDGILCFNDAVAFGVLDAVADLGLTVGQEVRVIGFDDVHDAALNRPSLSSVAVSASAGADAAELMLSRIRGDTEPPRTVLLDTKLSPRQTCGCHPIGARTTASEGRPPGTRSRPGRLAV